MMANSICIIIISFSLYYSPTCLAQAMEIISDQVEEKSDTGQENGGKSSDDKGNDSLNKKHTVGKNIFITIVLFFLFSISFFCILKFAFPIIASTSNIGDSVIQSNEPVVAVPQQVVINQIQPVTSIPVPLVEHSNVGVTNVKEINMDSKMANRISRDFSYNIYRMVKFASAISGRTTPPTGYEAQAIILLNKFLPQSY